MLLTIFTCVALLLMLLHTFEAKVEWRIGKKISEYGENLELVCSPDNFPAALDPTKRWVIYLEPGHQKPLTLNDATYDPIKYNTSIDEKGFSLIIKDFSKEDLNYPYQCFYGFTNKSEIIRLKEMDVLVPMERHPENESHSITIIYIIIGILAVSSLSTIALYFLCKRKDCNRRKQGLANLQEEGCIHENGNAKGNIEDLNILDQNVLKPLIEETNFEGDNESSPTSGNL